MPIGIISSLLLCTVLYISVSAVLTGMVPYDKINIDAPVSNAFAQVGLTWAQFLVSLGALTGITSVLLVLMLSQPRVMLAMARDRLIPQSFFGAIHEKFRTPWKATILTGCFVGVMASFLPLRILAELVNIGTLPSENWWRLIIWLFIGFSIYFTYGRKHSALRQMNERHVMK